MNAPFVNPKNLCEALRLCSVRKHDEEYFVGLKDASGNISEIPFSDIANSTEYRGKPIVRSYASGHVFLNETADQVYLVYLVTTARDGRKQHQFTGGSPLEDANREVFYEVGGQIRIRLDAAEENAEIRTYNRIGVRVTETYNELPLVDWVLMESVPNGAGETYWKLICLMHWVVKSYEGEIMPQIGVEDVVWGGWFDIDSLTVTPEVSPNAAIVTRKAQEIVRIT